MIGHTFLDTVGQFISGLRLQRLVKALPLGYRINCFNHGDDRRSVLTARKRSGTGRQSTSFASLVL